MLETFLIDEVKKLIGDGLTCPADLAGLNEVIELKNDLTKQLNALYTQVSSISDFVDPLIPVIDTAKTLSKTTQTGIDALAFIPSSAAVPIPVGPILVALDVIKVINDITGKSDGIISTGESYLNIITSQLKTVIDLLSMVDLFIGMCAEELEGPLNPQTAISDSLLKSTIKQSNQLSPVVTNFNGFEMAVVEVGNEIGGELTRRQAIATNSQGVVMLQGDPSFSSNDQILIDELVYYIKQNDLKA